jgi:hypothetical protein
MIRAARLDVDRADETALNRVCPYFTMFPLRFPYGILSRSARTEHRVLDPFCGRGTTNYAARLHGLDSVGLDASPVAAAIAAAKVVISTPAQVATSFDCILESVSTADVPEDEFWHWAYAPSTLRTLCRLRAGLLRDCRSASRVVLRAILLGALHGPVTRDPSYFSNQAPRTFASKPAYSVKFWKERGLTPTERDVRGIVMKRASRYLANEQTAAWGRILQADSREADLRQFGQFDWVVTSPPYYGMRTYVPDQWIRNWFVGGPASTDYSANGQLVHLSPHRFASDLATVWQRSASVSRPGARLVVRFGGINDRDADPLEIIKSSLQESGWGVQTIRGAGDATAGRRQAVAFAQAQAAPKAEYDVWAVRD